MQFGSSLHLMNGDLTDGNITPHDGPKGGDGNSGDAGAVYDYDFGVPLVVGGGAGYWAEESTWDNALAQFYVSAVNMGGRGGYPTGMPGAGPRGGDGGGTGAGGAGGGPGSVVPARAADHRPETRRVPVPCRPDRWWCRAGWR